MPTGEYSVAKGKPRRKIKNSDNSFISCMFAIFLFILLCVILLLVMLAVKWKRADGESEKDEAYSDKVRGTPTNSTSTTAATTMDNKLMRVVMESSTSSRWPSTSPRVTFESSSVEPTSVASTPETKWPWRATKDGGTTSGTISSSTTETVSSSLAPKSTDKSVFRMGVKDMTTEEITTFSTDHEGSTSFVTDVRTTTQMESTSASSGEERRSSTDVTSSIGTTLPTEPEDFSATNTDVAPTTSDVMTETMANTEKSTAESESLSTIVPSSEGDTTVPTGPVVDSTTNIDETTSNIPASSVFTEITTDSATSTPLEFTETTISPNTETTDDAATSTPLVYTERAVTSSTEVPASTISPKSVNETCDKLECKRLAGRMLAQMGFEFNPCDNFYMYACGGLHSDPFLQPYDYTMDMMNRIHEGMEKESHRQIAFSKFASFYKSCKEANGVEVQLATEITQILRDIGDFHDPTSGKDVNLTHFFAEIISLHRPLLFDIIVDVDESNSDRYMLKMTTPIHENPFRFGSHIPIECNPGTDIKNNSNLNEVYKNINICENEIKLKSLVNGIDEMFAILNRTDGYSIQPYHYTAAQSSEEWMDIFYKMEPTEPERRHSGITKRYTLVTVSELNKNYPVINWTVLLEKLLGKPLPDTTSVQLYSAEYFNKLFAMFKEDNIMQIYNGLLAAFVQQLHADLVINMIPNEEYCLTVAAKLMEEVAAGAYLNSFNRTQLDSKRSSVEKVFKQLQDTFKQLLHRSDWLGSDKDTLLKKLDSMTLAADGGVDVFTMRKLNDQMSSIDISEDSDSYVRNSIALLRRYRSNIFKSLDGKPRDPAYLWSHFSLPQEIYGVSIYGINTVAMPYALLAWPFFHPDYPEYLQIAGLGHIIAHEMSHHFDNVGVKYNPKGERATMLHGPAQTKYEAMQTCFEEQFNTTETQQSEDGKTFTFTLNAELHREEQLADDIATLLLYTLFKNQRYNLSAEQLPFLGMNNDQVFFLHLAQAFCTKDVLQSRIVSLFENEHLPSLLRVNHIVSQSKDFSDVFNCPVDSKMNPTHRCEVFPALSGVPV